MFRADMRCCVCDSRGHQIHHIDLDPTNHDLDNLVLLCFSHHDEVTAARALARSIGPDLLKRYRDDLYARVAARRALPFLPDQTQSMQPLAEDDLFCLMLDANVVMEADRVERRLSRRDWEESAKLVYQLSIHPTMIGVRARRAVLEVLSGLASRARHKMPPEVAFAIRNVAEDVLPIRSLYDPLEAPVPAGEEELLAAGGRIGFSLAYDGALYTHSLSVVDAGGELLGRLLAYARLNRLFELESSLSEHFDHASDAAERGSDAEAVVLLRCHRDWALEGLMGPIDYPESVLHRL